MALLILTGLVAGAYFASRQIYFLGSDEGGRIALYRGLPYDLPLDLELYSEVTSSPTSVASLPADRRDEATDHDLRSRSDAEDLIANLEQAAIEEAQRSVTPDRKDEGREKADRRRDAAGRQDEGSEQQDGNPRQQNRKQRSRGG